MKYSGEGTIISTIITIVIGHAVCMRSLLLVHNLVILHKHISRSFDTGGFHTIMSRQLPDSMSFDGFTSCPFESPLLPLSPDFRAHQSILKLVLFFYIVKSQMHRSRTVATTSTHGFKALFMSHGDISIVASPASLDLHWCRHRSGYVFLRLSHYWLFLFVDLLHGHVRECISQGCSEKPYAPLLGRLVTNACHSQA